MIGLLAGIDFSPSPSEFQALLDSGDLVEGLQYVTIELTRQEANDKKYLTSMFQGAAVKQNWFQGVHAPLTIKKAKVNGKSVVIVYPSAALPSQSKADKKTPIKKPPPDSIQKAKDRKAKETPAQDKNAAEAERLKCPKCGSRRLACKVKRFYKETGKPASRFIDLFGGIFMALTGVGVLWVTFSNWKHSPSLYLLVSGLSLLAGGFQALKYLTNEKIRKYNYKCTDCQHTWQLSETEQAEVDAIRATRSAAAAQRPVGKTGKQLPRIWLWLAVPAGLILTLVCGALIRSLPAILETSNSPSEPMEAVITVEEIEVVARPTSTATLTLEVLTREDPTHTLQPTGTPTPEPTNTPVPTQTPTEASLSPPASIATPLPGIETIPLEDMASRIPWLPLDTSRVPCVYAYGFNVDKSPFDSPLVRQAFALAVDRQAIIDLADDFNIEQPRMATAYTPPEVLGRDLYGEIGFTLDIDTAQALLAQAGFPDGKGLPEITLAFNDTRPINQVIADSAATQWRAQLGATIVLDPIDDWDDYVELISTDAPQIFRLSWCGSDLDPDRYLVPMFHSDSDNFFNFANAEFDDLVDQAAIARKPATRQIFYIQAEEILVEEEAVIIPLYHFSARSE